MANFNRYSVQNQSNEKTGQYNYGVVYDVILDSTNKRYTEPGDIGAITYRKYGDNTVSDENLPLAYPLTKNYIDLPVRNELVEIVIVENIACYRRYAIDISGNKNISSPINTINSRFLTPTDERKDIQDKNKGQHYESVMQTGIPRSNSDGPTSKNYAGYGNYFTPSNIHRLSLYEGDTLIESRFGQSIRLSAYNNPNKIFSPTIIIRNKESALTGVQSASSGSITEDINRDGSTIMMSSDEFLLPFIPGTIDNKGSTDFQQKPESFKPYPEKLKGDQILLNSGRIILSSRSGEMMFFSKGNYGFVSDGGLSIDNRLGINVSVGDDIHIVTKDRNINLVTGNGSIFLGNKDLEPLVKGQKLVDILGELIDEIGSMIFLTPSGPTAEGPKNRPEFGRIKSKLNDILSKINQTA